MTTRISHNRAGYLIIETDKEDADNIARWVGSDKIEIVRYEDDSIYLGRVKRKTKFGSRINQAEDGHYSTSLRVPAKMKVPVFGLTPLSEEAVVSEVPDNDELEIEIPTVRNPIRAIPSHRKPKAEKPKPDPELTLRQAVEAVNAHKARLGQDLCLSIDAKGELRALIEY